MHKRKPAPKEPRIRVLVGEPWEEEDLKVALPDDEEKLRRHVIAGSAIVVGSLVIGVAAYSLVTGQSEVTQDVWTFATIVAGVVLSWAFGRSVVNGAIRFSKHYGSLVRLAGQHDHEEEEEEAD